MQQKDSECQYLILSEISRILDTMSQSVIENKDIFTQILSALENDMLQSIFSFPNGEEQADQNPEKILVFKTRYQVFELICA